MTSSHILLSSCFLFLLMLRRPPRSTLFPTRRSSDLGEWAGTESSALQAIDVAHGSARVLGQLPSPRSQAAAAVRSEEHTSELQSRRDLVCRLLLEKKNKHTADSCFSYRHMLAVRSRY